MLTTLRFAALVVAVLTCLNPAISPMALAASTVGPDWATKLVFYNASNTDVAVMLTTPTASTRDGCPTSTAYFKAIDLTAGGAQQSFTAFQNSANGWFMLKRGHQVQVINVGINPFTHQRNYCLDGLKFGFGQIPTTCPDQFVNGGGTLFPDTKPGRNFDNPVIVPLPNGSVGFEGSLNEPGTENGQPAAATEALDISCVNGADCTLVVQLIPPKGGPYWTANLGAAGGGRPDGGGNNVFRGVTSFRNSWVKIPPSGSQEQGCDDNCVDPKTGLARPGVYPYGCSLCNVFPDPCPPCGTPVGSSCYPGHPESQFCFARSNILGNSGCLFARGPLVPKNTPGSLNGIQKFGGTVLCTYMGPLSPPKNCPK